MLESRPSHSPGVAFGYSLIATLLLLDFGLLLLLVNKPVTIASFLWGLLLLLSFLAMAFIAFWTSSLSATRYHVAGGALVIDWGRIRQVIPVTGIKSLILGETMSEVKGFRGVRWPGCFVGWGRVNGRNEAGETVTYETNFYATRPLRQQLLLVTESGAYAVSPVDLEIFMDSLGALQSSDLARSEDAPVADLSFLGWAIWRDRPAQAILVTAVILNGLLFAYLCSAYGRLPALVPLHFNQAGDVDRMAAAANLFVLPFMGLLVVLANSALGLVFYQWHDEPPVAFILWGASLIVQLATWVAMLGLLA